MASPSVAAPRVAAPSAETYTARPWAVGLEAGIGIGLFFATHARFGVTLGRRIARYLELSATITTDFGARLVGFEGVGGVGLALPLPGRWDLVMTWRVGVVGFHADLPGGSLWTHALTISVIAEGRFRLTPRVELRFAPIVATGFWDELWGFVMSPHVGVAVRF